MSYVEAAGADPTVCAPNTSAPLASVESETDTPSRPPSAEDFASLFASTRQSLTWLNGLFDRRADQVAANQRRQQQVTDALNHKGTNEPLGQADYSEPRQSTTRADRLRASTHDRVQSTDRTFSDQSDRQLDVERADRHAADKSPAKQSRFSQQSEAPERPRAQEPTPADVQTQQHEQPAAVPAEASAGSVSAEFVEGAVNPSVSTASTTVGSQMPVMPTEGQNSEVLPSQTQVGATVQNVQMTVAADMAKGGDVGTGVSQDSLQASTAAKGAEQVAKPGAATLDFTTVLTQVGKGQSAGSVNGNGLSAMGGKDALTETVKLTGPDTVQNLARVVRSNLSGRHASMVLRLDPPELGQLRVDVKMHDQVLLLRFHTETQAGQEALQARLSDLRVALQQHGIQLDRVEVEFRPPAPSHFDGSHTDQRHNGQAASGGGDSFFGSAQGHNGGANESFGTHDLTGRSSATRPESLAIESNELMDDEVARPAETGVDLVV